MNPKLTKLLYEYSKPKGKPKPMSPPKYSIKQNYMASGAGEGKRPQTIVPPRIVVKSKRKTPGPPPVPSKGGGGTSGEMSSPFSAVRDAMETLPSAVQKFPGFMQTLVSNHASWVNRAWSSLDASVGGGGSGPDPEGDGDDTAAAAA